VKYSTNPSNPHQCTFPYYAQTNDHYCTDVLYNDWNAYQNAFMQSYCSLSLPLLGCVSYSKGKAAATYNAYLILIGDSWNRTYPLNTGGFTTRQAVVEKFVSTIGSSAYYNAMLNQPSAANHLVLQKTSQVTSITYGPYLQWWGSLAMSILVGIPGEIWLGAFAGAARPLDIALDPNGVYIYMLDEKVTLPFLNQPVNGASPWTDRYCGSHNHAFMDCLTPICLAAMEIDDGGIGAHRDVMVQLGNKGCIPSDLTSNSVAPHADVNLDAALSTLAHELVESISSYPIGNACLNQFGTVKTLNGMKYTTSFGGSNYYLQKNFNPGKGQCVQA